MIELPRAALTADQIAESADFFSFGTNDLTQMTWGFSRDDVEASFFSHATSSRDLRGLAVRVARRRGRRRAGADAAGRGGRETKPDLKLGVCGEHGGDPRVDPLLRRRSGSTTCRARRSGSRSPGSRPAARRWLTPRRRRGGERLRTARRRGSGGPLQHARVVVADGAEQADAGARGPCCGRRRRYGAPASTSRVNASSTWPPSMSRSATMVCASTSSGLAAAAARAALRSTPWVRCSSLAIASPAAASASAGLASTSFWYSATARVDVAARRARPGRRRTAGRRPAPPRPRPPAPAGPSTRLVPAGDALGGQLLTDLVEQRCAAPRVAARPGSAGGRPAVEEHEQQRHLRDLHRLGDRRRGVDVDQAGEEPALVLARRRSPRRRPWLALSGACGVRVEDQHDRARSSRPRAAPWKFCSVDVDGVRRPARVRAPARRRRRPAPAGGGRRVASARTGRSRRDG